MYSKEQKVNEVARVIDVLKEDKKKISKKSILSLANKDMIDDNFIASVDWDFLLSHVDDSTPSKYLVNSKKRTDVCFEAFKNVLDKMIEDGIEISPQTIIKNNTGKSFSRTYYLHGAAIEYYINSRIRQYKEGNIKVRAGKSKTRANVEQLIYAKNLIDDMCEKEIPLTMENILKASDENIVPASFYSYHKEVATYIVLKRDGKTAARRVLYKKELEMPKKTLNNVQLDFLFGAIEFLAGKGLVSMDSLVELVMKGSSKDDFSEEEDSFEVFTAPEEFSAVRQALEDAGIVMAAAEVTMIPQTYVELTDPKDIASIQKTLDMLEDDDDVQDVYHNWDE